MEVDPPVVEERPVQPRKASNVVPVARTVVDKGRPILFNDAIALATQAGNKPKGVPIPRKANTNPIPKNTNTIPIPKNGNGVSTPSIGQASTQVDDPEMARIRQYNQVHCDECMKRDVDCILINPLSSMSSLSKEGEERVRAKITTCANCRVRHYSCRWADSRVRELAVDSLIRSGQRMRRAGPREVVSGEEEKRVREELEEEKQRRQAINMKGYGIVREGEGKTAANAQPTVKHVQGKVKTVTRKRKRVEFEETATSPSNSSSSSSSSEDGDYSDDGNQGYRKRQPSRATRRVVRSPSDTKQANVDQEDERNLLFSD